MVPIPNKDLLGLSAFVAIGTAIGTVLGFMLKEFLFPLALDVLKERRGLEAIFRKYRDPIILSARELANRLDEVIRTYPPDFLSRDLIAGPRPSRTYSALADPYYLRYKCESTLYRLCAFLGWLELYRQDIVFLQSGTRARDKQLDVTLKRVRSLLADGHINPAGDAEDWADALILREEQRAVGEEMIVDGPHGREVMSYGRFVAMLGAPAGTGLGVTTACHFLFDLRATKDFRSVRLKHLALALIDLMEVLGNGRLENRHVAMRATLRASSPPIADE